MAEEEMKEFFSRWKQGILDITPYQQAKITFDNTWVIVIGLICGVAVSIYNMKTLWWLLIILIAALVNTMVLQISNYQKYKTLEKIFGKEVQK